MCKVKDPIDPNGVGAYSLKCVHLAQLYPWKANKALVEQSPLDAIAATQMRMHVGIISHPGQ